MQQIGTLTSSRSPEALPTGKSAGSTECILCIWTSFWEPSRYCHVGVTWYFPGLCILFVLCQSYAALTSHLFFFLPCTCVCVALHGSQDIWLMPGKHPTTEQYSIPKQALLYIPCNGTWTIVTLHDQESSVCIIKQRARYQLLQE